MIVYIVNFAALNSSFPGMLNYDTASKAGIQKDSGCRIMSGMTGLGYLVAGLIMLHFVSLEPWTPGILESLIWIIASGDDSNLFITPFPA